MMGEERRMDIGRSLRSVKGERMVVVHGMRIVVGLCT